MGIDVIGTYVGIEAFLEPKGLTVNPLGDVLEVFDTKNKKALFVADTIGEVNDWVKREYGKNFLVEVE